METLRHGDMDMKTWTWRYRDIKGKTKAQATFLNPFTVCSPFSIPDAGMQPSSYKLIKFSAYYSTWQQGTIQSATQLVYKVIIPQLAWPSQPAAVVSILSLFSSRREIAADSMTTLQGHPILQNDGTGTP